MNDSKIIKRYCKEVKKALKNCGCYQKNIITKLELLAEDYFAACPEATEAAFRAQFGEPEAYAMECLAITPQELLIKKLQTKNRILTMVSAGIGIALLIMTVYFASALVIHYSASFGYHVQSLH